MQAGAIRRVVTRENRNYKDPTYEKIHPPDASDRAYVVDAGRLAATQRGSGQVSLGNG